MRATNTAIDDLEQLARGLDETERTGNIADQVIAIRAALRYLLARELEDRGRRGAR